MSGEKNLKQQRKAFIEMLKNLIFLETSNPFVSDKIIIKLPTIPNMNKENIKPALKQALGYVPEILTFQETFVLGKNCEKIPVVLVELQLKQ